MFGSTILDVAIALVFVYLLVSLICTVLTEGIARVLALRSGTLEQGIRNLLTASDGRSESGDQTGSDSKSQTEDGSGDSTKQDLTQDLYAHPLIKGLYQQGWVDRVLDKLPLLNRKGKPSYIPSRTFALALLDTVASDKSGSTTLKSVEDIANKIDSNTKIGSEIKNVLLLLTGKTENSMEKARENIENWFDDAMDRVSGWYKRKAQLIILGVAVIVVLALNVDTIAITNRLWVDEPLRSSAVTAATTFAEKNTDPKTVGHNISDLQEQLQSLQLPIGWSKDNSESSFGGILSKLGGLVITMIAVSLGAPFWFDTLNKLIRVRSAGEPPEKSSEEQTG